VKTLTGKKEGFVGSIVLLLTATDSHFAVHGRWICLGRSLCTLRSSKEFLKIWCRKEIPALQFEL
jgi:hypothetical protein